MIIIPGKLLIAESKQEGKLVKTGWLDSSIGRFNVKYDQIEALELGWHEGFFEISLIQQGYYKTFSRHNFELEPILNKVIVNFIGQPSPSEKSTEQITPVNAISAINISLNTKQNNLLEAEFSDEELFGELWPIGGQVKLDHSQSRSRLRSQCERLDQLGYKFNDKLQLWYKDEQLAA